MANATVINPADGSENNAAPHTEVTSMNVPMNSAINLRVIVPASSKDPPAMFRGNTPMIASAEVLGSPTARFRSRASRPKFAPPTPVLLAFARARQGLSLKDGEILKSAPRATVTQRLAPLGSVVEAIAWS